MTEDELGALIDLYRKQKKAFSGFLSNVTDFFSNNDDLVDNRGHPCVHSLKWRLKDDAHLREKINRKEAKGISITGENIFSVITDLAGARVMHLKRADFPVIHAAILSHVQQQHWCFAESPKAYTWDPEYKPFFDNLGIKNEIKESFYTSVHYVVKPNMESLVSCELQVRSLFEEIWGEVDHDLNYPMPTTISACSEQLKVLAKLVGAGTRLVDSIYNSVDG